MAGVPVKDRPQVSSMLYPNSVEARWRIGSLISARTITDGGQFSFLLRKGTTVETPSNNEITPYPPVRNPSVWISWPPYLRLCAVSSNANKPVFCETSRLYVEGLFKKTLVKWTLFVVCRHATLATSSFQVNRHWIRKGWAPSRQLFVWGKGWRAVSAGESFWCDAWIVIRWVYSVEVHNGKVQVANFQRQCLCLKTCDVFLIGSDFFMVFIAAPFPYLRGPRNRGGFHAKPDSMLQYHVLILGMAFNCFSSKSTLVTLVVCIWPVIHLWHVLGLLRLQSCVFDGNVIGVDGPQLMLDESSWVHGPWWLLFTVFFSARIATTMVGSCCFAIRNAGGTACFWVKLGVTHRDTVVCFGSSNWENVVWNLIAASQVWLKTFHLHIFIPIYCIYFVLKWSRSNINLYFFNEPRVMKSNAEDQTWYDPTAFLFLEWCMMFDVVAQ